jgi:ribosomal protein L20A (L18A)
MAEIIGRLRWFPLGPIEGPLEPINKEDLDQMAKNLGTKVSVEEMRGAVLGETRGKAINEITQWLVTVSADNEEAFRKMIQALVKKYRAPRTTYATLGSEEKVRRMIEEIFDEEDGWV